MTKKRKKIYTKVKPHERRNSKSDGKHHVKGHERKIGEKTNVREHWRQVGGSRCVDVSYSIDTIVEGTNELENLVSHMRYQLERGKDLGVSRGRVESIMNEISSAINDLTQSEVNTVELENVLGSVKRHWRSIDYHSDNIEGVNRDLDEFIESVYSLRQSIITANRMR